MGWGGWGLGEAWDVGVGGHGDSFCFCRFVAVQGDEECNRRSEISTYETLFPAVDFSLVRGMDGCTAERCHLSLYAYNVF